jgi:cob(I)alamin adenosyltransferase
MNTKGLNMVITGDGKGKTTSALGMGMRILGHGQKLCVIQFIKSPDSKYAERDVMISLGAEWHQLGAGFTWIASDEQTIETTRIAWQTAQEKVMGGQYNMVILDEINIAVSLSERKGLPTVSANELINLMKNKPAHTHLVMTGRYADSRVIEQADLVSEIQCIKHPFQQGIPAQMGVEF